MTADGCTVPETASALAPGTIYLLHFAGRTSRNHQHYLGCTQNLQRRLSEHRGGRGARETQTACEEALAIKLAASWQGSVALEHQIKAWMKAGRRSYARFCPYCGGDPTAMPEFLQAALGPLTTRVRIDPTVATAAVGSGRASRRTVAVDS